MDEVMVERDEEDLEVVSDSECQKELGKEWQLWNILDWSSGPPFRLHLRSGLTFRMICSIRHVLGIALGGRLHGSRGPLSSSSSGVVLTPYGTVVESGPPCKG